jgi:hypothetical protein
MRLCRLMNLLVIDGTRGTYRVQVPVHVQDDGPIPGGGTGPCEGARRLDAVLRANHRRGIVVDMRATPRTSDVVAREIGIDGISLNRSVQCDQTLGGVRYAHWPTTDRSRAIFQRVEVFDVSRHGLAPFELEQKGTGFKPDIIRHRPMLEEEPTILTRADLSEVREQFHVRHCGGIGTD